MGLLESSVIRTLILAMTCNPFSHIKHELQVFNSSMYKIQLMLELTEQVNRNP
jgi:hypothetical protein